MVVPRFTARLDHVEIQSRRLQACARPLLPHHAAVNFFPRGLVAQHRRLPRSAARLQFPFGQHNIDLSLGKSMRMRSPVFSNARPPPTAASGETFRIEGLAEVPLCRPSPIVGSVVTPSLISEAGGCMFTTSALPGYPTGPQLRMISTEFASDAKIGILDASVVVLGAFKHDRLRLENIRVLGILTESACGIPDRSR